MANLEVTFAGLKFRNPVWIASMSPTAPWHSRKDAPDIYLRVVKKFYDMGVGAFSTGLIWFEDPKFQWCGVTRHTPISVRGFMERGGISGFAFVPDGAIPFTNGMEMIRRIKKQFPDMGLIANICGPQADPEGWGDLAAAATQAGADMLELNLNTFMVQESTDQAVKAIEQRGERPVTAGITAALVPDVVVDVVKGVLKRTSVPIMLKMSPEMAIFRAIPAAQKYKASGVAGVVCSHAFMGVPPPDIYNHGRPTAPYMDKVCIGFSGTGPQARISACYRNVAGLAKYVPGLDIAACGGLVIPEHAIEAMMLGAKVVQLCSGIMFNGLSFASQVIEFMNKYMDEQGYKRVDDFTGKGLEYFVEFSEVVEWVKAHPRTAKIDYLKCIKCGNCLDNFCWATDWKNGRPKVDPKRCSECYICVFRCPVGARSLVPIKAH